MTTSLTDLSRLYAGVRQRLLLAPARAAAFFARMAGAPYLFDRSDAGYIILPFRTKGRLAPRTCTCGWWVHDLVVPCAFDVSCAARTQADAATRQIRAEELRVLVRAALKTW